MTLWGRLFCFNSGEILELKDHEYTVGRKNSCSITINDIATSSLHFKIHLQSGIPFITDSSRNGTIVNGKKIDSTPLLDFSEIKIQYDHYFVFLKPETKLPLLNDKFYLFESLLLGSGSFSNVYLAIDTITLERLACKAIKTKSLLLSSTKIDKEYERIKQEMSILKRIRHKNIISILDTSLSSDGTIVYLFLNRVNGGELFDRIVRDGAIPESETLFLFYQILLAIQYLHDHDICHRDIKAENLLLESPEPYSKIVLTDFGLCKSLESSVNMQTRCGTSTYLAPEILDNSNGYTKQVDCWSCGVLLYTM
jgi:serine/threonine-protein kinase Chk2